MPDALTVITAHVLKNPAVHNLFTSPARRYDIAVLAMTVSAGSGLACL